MAGNASTVRVTFLGDASQLAREAKKVEGATDGIGKKAGAMGAALKGGLITVGAAAVGALGVAMVRGVGQASDYNETVSKARVIFGDNAKAMTDWAANANKQFGLTRAQALDTATGFGNMFQQLGFTGDAAVKMSQSVVQLSTDLGSFNNLPTADVADMMAAAFRGEYDSLQALIPTINAAAVEQEALATTGKKTTKELTQQEKAAATLALITKGAASANNDFAETSTGLAGQQKILRAQFGEATTALGAALLPTVTRVANFMSTNVPAAMAATKAAFRVVVDFVRANVIPIWERNRATVMSTLATVGATIRSFVELAQALWRVFGDTIVMTVKSTFNNFMTVIRGALTVVKGLFDVFAGVLTGDWRRVWEGLKGIVVGAWNVIKGLVGEALNRVRAIFSLFGDGLGALWRGIWSSIVGVATGAISKTLGVLQGLFGVLGKLPGPFGAPFRAAAEAAGVAKGKIDAVTAAINRVPTSKSSTITVTTVNRTVTVAQKDGKGGGVQARASGGPVMPGQPYLVGEEGPELIVPSRAGTVLTASQTAGLGGNIYNLNLNGVALDARMDERAIADTFRRMELMAGMGA